VVLLGLVGAGFGLAWADMKVRTWAETTAEHLILRRLPQADHVDVTLDGFPFTTGVLLNHEVAGLHVHVDAVHHRGWELSELSLDVRGIELDRRALLDEGRLVVTAIDIARIEGSIAADELSTIVGQPIEIDHHSIWTTRGLARIELTPVLQGPWIILHEQGSAANPMYYPLPVDEVIPCAPKVETAPDKLTLSCSVQGLSDELSHALTFG